MFGIDWKQIDQLEIVREAERIPKGESNNLKSGFWTGD